MSNVKLEEAYGVYLKIRTGSTGVMGYLAMLSAQDFSQDKIPGVITDLKTTVSRLKLQAVELQGLVPPTTENSSTTQINGFSHNIISQLDYLFELLKKDENSPVSKTWKEELELSQRIIQNVNSLLINFKLLRGSNAIEAPKQKKIEPQEKVKKETSKGTVIFWLVALAALIAAVAVPESRRMFVLMTVIIISAGAAFAMFKEPEFGLELNMGIWPKVKKVAGNVFLALIMGFTLFSFLLAPVYWFAYPNCKADVTVLWPDAHTGVAPSDEAVSEFFTSINDSRCPDGRVLGSLQYVFIGTWLVAALISSWKLIKQKTRTM